MSNELSSSVHFTSEGDIVQFGPLLFTLTPVAFLQTSLPPVISSHSRQLIFLDVALIISFLCIAPLPGSPLPSAEDLSLFNMALLTSPSRCLPPLYLNLNALSTPSLTSLDRRVVFCTPLQTLDLGLAVTCSRKSSPNSHVCVGHSCVFYLVKWVS